MKDEQKDTIIEVLSDKVKDLEGEVASYGDAKEDNAKLKNILNNYQIVFRQFIVAAGLDPNVDHQISDIERELKSIGAHHDEVVKKMDAELQKAGAEAKRARCALLEIEDAVNEAGSVGFPESLRRIDKVLRTRHVPVVERAKFDEDEGPDSCSDDDEDNLPKEGDGKPAFVTMSNGEWCLHIDGIRACNLDWAKMVLDWARDQEFDYKDGKYVGLSKYESDKRTVEAMMRENIDLHKKLDSLSGKPGDAFVGDRRCDIAFLEKLVAWAMDSGVLFDGGIIRIPGRDALEKELRSALEDVRNERDNFQKMVDPIHQVIREGGRGYPTSSTVVLRKEDLARLEKTRERHDKLVVECNEKSETIVELRHQLAGKQ